MSTKVYVLLEVCGDAAQVGRILQGRTGVTGLDVLDGPPDIIMVVEAQERLKAAEYLMGVLASVDGMIEGLRVLPVLEYAK